MNLLFNYPNVCDHSPPTLQKDRQTDKQTDGRSDNARQQYNAISHRKVTCFLGCSLGSNLQSESETSYHL